MTPGSAPPTAYPAVGEVIDGKYQIERILGEGGMGCVARAYHTMLRAPVALKFMNPQFMVFPGAVDRFLNEGIASKAIKSDHVVPVDDVGKLPSGAPYLVMPCLDGVDLGDLIARDARDGMPVERAIHFVLQILRGLQAAHAMGIIHRDMKPSNCFVVVNDGYDDFVKILDFGISKVQQPGSASLTQTNSSLGTPLYMSPEQARSPRDVDVRTDLYSVGVILYELLTGRTPFLSESGDFIEILFKLFTTDPPPVKSFRPDIPDALAEVVHKALARDPADRYSTAVEMAQALDVFCDERSKHLLPRMLAFKPPTAGSIAPPDMLPSSMLAFSAIEAGYRTGIPPRLTSERPTSDRAITDRSMTDDPTTFSTSGRPTTDWPTDRSTSDRPAHDRQRGILAAHTTPPPAQVAELPATEMVARVVVASSGYVSAAPTAEEARARLEEGTARTHYSTDPPVRRVVVSGTSTDLGASRDALPSDQPTRPPGRSPLLYVVPLLAIVAAGGLGLIVARAGSKATSSGTIQTPPAESAGLSRLSPPPPVSTPPASAPSAIASTATSASSSAEPSGVPSGKPKPPPKGAPPRRPQPPGGHDPGLDPGIMTGN